MSFIAARRNTSIGCPVLSVAQGLTAKEIAREFGIAPGTVVKRLACAMFKLGVHRQGAMVAEAMRRQIITPLCLLLAGLIALHTSTGSEMVPRDRRPTDGASLKCAWCVAPKCQS